jgi:hypothetical protein
MLNRLSPLRLVSQTTQISSHGLKSFVFVTPVQRRLPPPQPLYATRAPPPAPLCKADDPPPPRKKNCKDDHAFVFAGTGSTLLTLSAYAGISQPPWSLSKDFLSLQVSEMDLAKSAFIRKVLIKRERREDFQKILPTTPSSESVYSLERLLVFLLAI